MTLHEKPLQDLELLHIIADVGGLHDRLWRAGDGDLHLFGVFQDRLCQCPYFRRHSGREHDGLAVGGQLLIHLHDVIVEPHVEHTVCLV